MQNLRNALFVPHGSPTFALEPGAAGESMSQLASSLDRPRAIVVISPHWDTAVPTVSTATQLETIHGSRPDHLQWPEHTNLASNYLTEDSSYIPFTYMALGIAH